MHLPILNLTQHAATAEQLAAGVVDLPAKEKAELVRLLTVDTLPTREELLSRVWGVADLADKYFDSLGKPMRDAEAEFSDYRGSVMLGGAPWMMSRLEDKLYYLELKVLYAFSVRESAEETMPDGSVRKVNTFRHAGFVSGLAL